MRICSALKLSILGIASVLALAGVVSAQDSTRQGPDNLQNVGHWPRRGQPYPEEASCPPAQEKAAENPPEKTPEKQPEKPVEPAPDRPVEPELAPETSAAVGGDSYAASSTFMMGDFPGGFATQLIPASGKAAGVNAIAIARVPVAAFGAYKICENESPLPQDRVFISYNYFAGFQSPFNVFAGGAPGIGSIRNDLQREVIGGEKTFFGGYFSVGVRLPFVQSMGGSSTQTVQIQQAPGFAQITSSIPDNAQIGDVSLFFKYAFIRTSTFGLTGGLALTTPTGEGITYLTPVRGQIDTFFPQQTKHPVLIQPWLGYVYNADRFFVQGFASVMAPTDSQFSTLLFNDISVGYWIYRDNTGGGITGLIPTLELHLNTPVTNRGLDAQPVGFPDLFDVTAGMILRFGQRTYLNTGIVIPVTGPRFFDVEALAQLNVRF